MKKWIIGVSLAAILVALLPSSGLGGETSNVTVTVVCFNTSIHLSTDRSDYQYTDSPNMTVLINNTQNANNLNEKLIIELYDSGWNFVKYMAADDAIAPAGGTNTTSYFEVLNVTTGDYILRARMVPAFDYPSQNITARMCDGSSTRIQSDKNITVTDLRPNGPMNLRAILNKTDESVILNWTLSNSSNITNYIIYVTDNWASGFNYSDPYTTVPNTSTNWTDWEASGLDERYYIVRANNTLGLTDENTYAVGKYNLKMYSGWNLLSLPLLIWNDSMEDVFYKSDNGDISERWVGTTQTFQRTDYFGGFGWSGQFVTVQVDRGYWYYSQKAGYDTSPFNNSIVGAVPQASRSETIYNKSWALLGWTSVNTKDLNSMFPSAANGDIIEYYDAPTDTYKRTDYFTGFGWFGQFANIEPGRGYWYYSQNSALYNWTYQP